MVCEIFEEQHKSSTSALFYSCQKIVPIPLALLDLGVDGKSAIGTRTTVKSHCSKYTYQHLDPSIGYFYRWRGACMDFRMVAVDESRDY